MKQYCTRRQFIKSVALAAAIAPVTMKAVPHSLFASDNNVPTLAGSVAPSVFIRGVVTTKSSTELTLQVGHSVTKVNLPEGIPVFRNGFVTSAHIQQGDEAAIAAVPASHGMIEARRLWINLPEYLLGSSW